MICRVYKDGVLIGEEEKMKGIHQTAHTSQTLNTSLMDTLVADTTHPPVTLSQFQIKKNLFETKIWNVELLKRVSFQSRKRWFLPSPNPLYDTLPFGYCKD